MGGKSFQIVLFCIPLKALSASSDLSKQTNPKPFDFPSESFKTIADLMVPYGSKSFYIKYFSMLKKFNNAKVKLKFLQFLKYTF